VGESQDCATTSVPPNRKGGRRNRALDAAIGQRVRAYRKKAKLSLENVAAKLGIAYQQVQKYETGANRIGAGCLLELAQILGVPVAVFFSDPSEVHDGVVAHRSSSATGHPFDAHALALEILQISDQRKRARLQRLVRRLAKS